jgi:hypothetical protein
MRENRFVFASWFVFAFLLNIVGFVSCASATIMEKPQLLPDNTVNPWKRKVQGEAGETRAFSENRGVRGDQFRDYLSIQNK